MNGNIVAGITDEGKKKTDAKRISVYIAAVIVFIGVILHMKDAYDTAMWWHNEYDPDGTVLKIITDTLENFFGEWFIITSPVGAVPTIAMIYLVVQLFNRVIRRFSRRKGRQPEAAAKTERRIGRVLFILSFLPFVLFIIGCFVSMFTGAKAGLFGSRMVYGAEAFETTFVWYGLALCILPVFPTMLIYQIVYAVNWAKRKNAKENAKGE